MPADANIFQAYLQPPKSVMDYQAQYDQADARKNALQQSVLALQKGQMDMANAADVSRQRNALRDAITSGQIDLSNPDHAPKALAIAPDVAPAMLKTVQEGATSRAKAGLDNAQAGKATQETQIAGHAQHLQALSTVNDPQAAVQWITDGVRSGALPAAGLQQALDRLQQAATTPDGFAQWKQQTQAMGLTVQQQMEQTTAKPTEVRLGNVVKTIDMNPHSQTFGKEVVGQQAIGVSPDTEANNATSIRTTGMNNATSVRTTGMNNATSTANNRANIAKDYAVNGLNPDGTPNTGNQGAMVDMLGNYQLNPTLALQRLPAGQRAALVGQVQAKYPGWDETQYDAKKGAAAKFTSGDLGNALRSVSTANAHLDQLGDLADALGNGNTQVINRVGNYFSTQMGDPKVTNFDSIKAIVGQEVVKAIVAGGGTGGERDEATHAFDSAKSPQQLKGVIQHYRAVMAAQQNNLLAQRDAAGLPRSTLPNYGGASGAPATPPGWGIQRVK